MQLHKGEDLYQYWGMQTQIREAGIVWIEMVWIEKRLWKILGRNNKQRQGRRFCNTRQCMGLFWLQLLLLFILST